MDGRPAFAQREEQLEGMPQFDCLDARLARFPTLYYR